MHDRLFLGARVLAALASSFLAAPASAQLHVDRRHPSRLLDARGEWIRSNLVGVNDEQIASHSIEEIGKSGANCVREFWTTQGNPWAHGLPNSDDVNSLCALIDRAEKAHLIYIASLWDATGASFSDPKFQRCVQFWVDNATKLKGYADDMVLDVANEAGWTKDGDFLSSWKQTIAKIRAAGYRQPIMVEAPDYGRGAPTLFADSDHNGKPDCKDILQSDPLKNVVFSWHLYDPESYAQGHGSKQAIHDLLASATAADVCFSIGEFAHVENNKETSPRTQIAWQYAMQECAKRDFGCLPWIWYSVGDRHSLTTDGVNGHWATYEFDGKPAVKWGEDCMSAFPYSVGRRAMRTKAFGGK